jgi:activator of HSP90 ATPase
MPDVRVNAIRSMYDGAENDHVRLSSGEVIYSWVLLDDSGAVVNHWELDNAEIVEAYNENTTWMEPEYEKIG